MARKKSVNDKPVRKTVEKILVDNVLWSLDGESISNCGATIMKMIGDDCSDEEISNARFKLDCWYEDTSLRIVTDILEDENVYNKRVADWQKRKDDAEASERATYERLKQKFENNL